MRQTRSKIEFYMNTADKQRLVELSKAYGYTLAETMRRAAEEKMLYMDEHLKLKERAKHE